MHIDPTVVSIWDNKPCFSPWNRANVRSSLQRRCVSLSQEGPNASWRALHLLSTALVTMEIFLFPQMIGLNKYTFGWAWTVATTCKHLWDAWNNSQHEEQLDATLWYAFKKKISFFYLKKGGWSFLLVAVYGGTQNKIWTEKDRRTGGRMSWM